MLIRSAAAASPRPHHVPRCCEVRFPRAGLLLMEHPQSPTSFGRRQ